MKQKVQLENEWHWSARKMSPKVILYVAIIFIAFIALAYWGFHSLAAVKTLFFTALAYILSVLPIVFSHLEYRLSAQKLESRQVKKQDPKPYKTLFQLAEVSHLVKSSGSLKYCLNFEEANRFHRFFKKHFSDRYSGEIKLAPKDSEQIIAALKGLGVVVKV
jgi:hypothetical protein